MSEMVERVARAIYAVHMTSRESWEDAGGDVPHSTVRGYYFAQARAAINAMREPTIAMLDTSDRLRTYAEVEWQRMIDAALGD